MEKEHRITYKAGITRTPSDFLCQDGELAECINLATDNEELKPVVQPTDYVTSAVDSEGSAVDLPTFIFIHKYNDEERYVGWVLSGNQKQLCWGTVSNKVFTLKDLFTIGGSVLIYSDGTKISSIGKTLMFANKNGINHFIWFNDSYKELGQIPELKFDFWLVNESIGPQERSRVKSSANSTGIIYWNGSISKFATGSSEDYNDLVLGLYFKNKKQIKSKRHFCNPFYIRTAVELYDGTYTHISQPILMLPCVTENTFATFLDAQNEDRTELFMFTHYSELHFRQSTDLSEWEDVVRNVVVFITDEIEVHNLDSDQLIDGLNISSGQVCEFDGIFRPSRPAVYSEYVVTDYQYSVSIDDSTIRSYMPLDKKEEPVLLNNLKSSSIFYKLCSVGLKPILNETDIASLTDPSTLVNLTTQERLSEDDFYSHTDLFPQFVYAYNSRLNLANVARSMFEGYGYFMPFDNSNETTYDFYVRIKTDYGKIWVHHSQFTRQKQGIYFYYPDPRADRVTIYKGNSCVCDQPLTEHPRLNGAYYLKGLPGKVADEETVSVHSVEGFDPNRTNPDVNNTTNNYFKENLPNYIITSEVNNPWVFKAEGYNKVGTGKIIGMSTITQALSQGQFGQYPLIVFSESGIWAMSVDRTGLYNSISPMSRDICINPECILQTDGAVFFVSKKGLMAVAGNEVVCVSERMNGAAFNTAMLSPLATDTDWEDIVGVCQDSSSFLDYIRDEEMFMAYDYIDSRIVMMNTHYDYSFVYNIPDGTISKVILPADMTNAVNNYPDYLIQGRKPNDQVWVYSFYGKPREEEVADRSLAFLLTRPMKLAGPVSQTSLRQLINVGTWKKRDMQGNELSCVKTEVYVSEDQNRWYADISRHGAAARYYRLALYIKMLPTERLSGTILTEQERRSHNMR